MAKKKLLAAAAKTPTAKKPAVKKLAPKKKAHIVSSKSGLPAEKKAIAAGKRAHP